jgi:hypothetical protein
MLVEMAKPTMSTVRRGKSVDLRFESEQDAITFMINLDNATEKSERIKIFQSQCREQAASRVIAQYQDGDELVTTREHSNGQ